MLLLLSLNCDSGQDDPLGIVQEIEIWPYEQMIYAQTSICPREWDTQTPLGFWDTNRSPNLDQKTRPYDNQQKKKKKKKEKREREKLWTVLPIVIGALGTVTKGLAQGLEDLEIIGRVETIQTTAFLDRPENKETRRLEETCCHSNSSERPSANAGVKNSHGVKQ